MRSTYIIVMVSLTVALAKELQHKIVGGTRAAANQFPYQVSLQRRDASGSYEHFCGGSVLGPRCILTAAHCILGEDMRVRAGILRLDDPATVGRTVKVRTAFVHPGYDGDHGGVSANDLAVLQLESALTYSESIKPIDLPQCNQTYGGTATLSGWGRTFGLSTKYSNDLMFAELPVISLDECKAAFVDVLGSYGPLRDTNFCTQDGATFPCQGDSGGPLVRNGTLLGVVSFSTVPCDFVGSPTAYTDVAMFADWIKDRQRVAGLESSDATKAE